ncbi:MAG: hypothetical protein KH274_04990 [Veillonella sp. oral taxon 780]|jgi:hypothetical protein|uniref:hypothetical protein n=1 Tax=Veillonella sp. DNF00869 TaxID=1384081 RepID=UPI0007851395|nr:hypothetical protein [Veillonella sp. DNF00869]KXB86700.1 hypothetical protein HMPREF3032_01380 [Veillonella sp. DNF00869]MBS6626814.1 hypothetical protein [Veillonella sp. oral taxon 780]
MNTVNDVDRLYNAIEINEKTFQFFQIDVQSYGIQQVNKGSTQFFYILLEIMNGKFNCNLEVIVNCYDELGTIIYSNERTVYIETYIGYDTLKFWCNDTNLIDRTNKIRIFVKKE